VLSWCKENQIYLILDLHAAPGGQSKDNIADYNPAYPCLWEDEIAKMRTIYLWKTIAARYANEEWIGGYDLINEPVYDFGSQGNLPLETFIFRLLPQYALLTKTICCLSKVIGMQQVLGNYHLLGMRIWRTAS
jgi:hypothetical protein